MIVANTSIFMGSDHRLEEKDSRTETLRIWVDPPPVESSADKVTLSPQAKEASLSADGSDETLPFLQGGSGFLALDANGDGRINSGSELFGPATGSGFTELAKYDGDQNGWIDEKDAAYKSLSIWTKAADGTDIFTGLKAGGVGAIFTGYTDTSFALKDDMNNVRGQIRRTGLYLSEDGRAGSIQQLDFAV